MGGGYIGVDVFFVLSGFLITNLIRAELEETGTVALRDFFGRRIRRLLPASALVAITTLIYARFTLPPLRFVELRADAVATVTYLANLRFARDGMNYLAAESHSPFQHYWSLALEEQFYFVWPLLLLSAYFVARSLGLKPRSFLLVAIVLVLALSLSLSILVTPWRQPWAFFLLPTRAWELAAGGVLAICSGSLNLLVSRKAGNALLGTGLAVIAVSAFAFGHVAEFPGWLAAVPVVGTILAISGGDTDGPFRRALATRPMQSIGKRSYSIYLWHWPILVFAGATPDGTVRMAWRLVFLAASIALAYLTYAFVENPIRNHKSLRQRPVWSLSIGAGITSVSLVVAIAATSAPSLHSGTSAAPPQVRTAHDLWRHTPPAVPDNLRPPLLEVRRDIPRTYSDSCHLGVAGVDLPRHCMYGDLQASRSIVLFGDSHAAHWFPAFAAFASSNRWKLVSRTKSGCSPYDVEWLLDGRRYHECAEWRQDVIEELRSSPPAVVVVAGRYSLNQDGISPEAYTNGIRSSLGDIRAGEIVLLGNMPVLDRDIPVCLSGNIHSPSRCAVEAKRAQIDGLRTRERAAARAHGAKYINLVSLLCPKRRCPTMSGNLLVYRDSHHLTTRFAKSLAPVVGAWISEAE